MIKFSNIISYHIISYHITSYHIISYHIISYFIISYHFMFILARLELECLFFNPVLSLSIISDICQWPTLPQLAVGCLLKQHNCIVDSEHSMDLKHKVILLLHGLITVPESRWRGSLQHRDLGAVPTPLYQPRYRARHAERVLSTLVPHHRCHNFSFE